jgi:hypothetical protein
MQATPKNIRDLIEKFAEDLAAATRDNISAALGLRPTTTKPVTVAAVTTRKRGRRSADDIETMKALVLNHVRAHAAGSRIEEIAVGLGLSTKELTLPVRALLAEKALTKKGQRRATRYFVPKSR